MKKDKAPDKMVRLTDYTAMLLARVAPATQKYWDDLDRKAGKECSPLTASDVIRTALGRFENELVERGYLQKRAS